MARVVLVCALREQGGERETETKFLLQRRRAGAERCRIGGGFARHDSDDLTLAGEIEVHARKYRTQRQQRRGIKLRAVVDIESDRSAGRETLLEQTVKLSCQQMERDIAALKGI